MSRQSASGDRTDLLVPDPSATIDDERFRYTGDAEVDPGPRRRVARDAGVGVAELRQPAAPRGGIVLPVDAVDRHAARGDLEQHRVLGRARRAPRGEQVEQVRLAEPGGRPEVGRRKAARPVEAGEAEGGERTVDHHRRDARRVLRQAVGEHRDQRAEGDDRRDEQQALHAATSPRGTAGRAAPSRKRRSASDTVPPSAISTAPAQIHATSG